MMWNWYEWNSLEDFNTWHEAKKIELGLPKPGVNQKTGQVDEASTWTTEYTSVMQVDGKWIGVVEDLHSSGLSTTLLRPPTPDFV